MVFGVGDTDASDTARPASYGLTSAQITRTGSLSCNHAGHGACVLRYPQREPQQRQHPGLRARRYS